MSVVVFDTETKVMTADTAVSYGSHTTYSCHKMAREELPNGVTMLVGGIGTPPLVEVAKRFAMETIIAEMGDNPSVERFDGAHIPGVNENLIQRFDQTMEVVGKHLSDKSDFTLLIVLKDVYDNIAIGVMEQTPIIAWGIHPLPGRSQIVIGSREVSVAFNAATHGNTRERLAQTSLIQFIGTGYNKFEIKGF